MCFPNFILVFFFSSRRRHTRSLCDWSSDVCSSDLVTVELADGRKSDVGLADGVRFEIMERRSSDDALILGDEVLIGQTLLEKMDLLVDGTRQRLVPAHQEGPVNKLK